MLDNVIMNSTYNTFVFGCFVDIILMQTFCDMMPQTSGLHPVLHVDGTDVFPINC